METDITANREDAKGAKKRFCGRESGDVSLRST